MVRIPLPFLLSLVLITLASSVSAQQNPFTGLLVFTNDIQPSSSSIPLKEWKEAMMIGDSMRFHIGKNGYLQETEHLRTVYINAEKKTYQQFKGFDTLYYFNDAEDSNAVRDVELKENALSIAGYNCHSLSFKTRTGEYTYHFAPALPVAASAVQMPITTVSRALAGINGIVLRRIIKRASYTYTRTCVRVLPGEVDDTILRLPDLPQKKKTENDVVTSARFNGSWGAFLQRNLKAELANTYLVIPKKQDMAMQTVLIEFIVDRNGAVIDPKVINPEQVHPKLAEEALRVFAISPAWIPAKRKEEGQISILVQPISFVSSY